MSDQLTIGQTATLACVLEVSAPKPGNVHRSADFEDTTFNDFLVSAIVIGRELEHANKNSLGELIFSCVHETRRLVGRNTNLGLILLLAPLCKASRNMVHRSDLAQQLGRLDRNDAAHVYNAIKSANAGGLGKANENDVYDSSPPECLINSMRSAADRDTIALQYANNFEQVYELVVPVLIESFEETGCLSTAIVRAQLMTLREIPDTLIARKCGTQVALRASAMAADVLATGTTEGQEYLEAISNFDFWLRSDGHRRNPGTTADLIGAGLFVAIRNGLITAPFH